MKDKQQKIITDWAARCFGEDQVNDPGIRALRLVEEAVEFAQAVKVPCETLHSLVNHVFSRPIGKPDQELGGVAVTALIAASSINVQLDDVCATEIERVLAKPVEHFAQRNQVKVDAGFGRRLAPREENANS